jgi:hypothetical protein
LHVHVLLEHTPDSFAVLHCVPHVPQFVPLCAVHAPLQFT